MSNLEDVIAGAVEDNQLPDEPVEETSDESSDESSEVEAPSGESPADDTSATEAEESEAKAEDTEEAPEQDEFEKKYGIAAQSSLGRENRIPYSRVKKITEKSVNEIAEIALGRKLAPGEKAADTVKAYVARIPEMEAKVTDYEARLDNVGRFEEIMANDPDQFLGLLAKIPAYTEFFNMIEDLYNKAQGTQAPAGDLATQAAATPPPDDMPQPDEQLADGSMSYSMEGLKQLLAWQAKQVEERVTRQVEERYQPIESEWRAKQRVESLKPMIQAQIEDAYTWPGFKENEEEITAILAQYPKATLDQAYRHVVLPKLNAEKEKLVTNRDQMRQELLQELKKAPRATAASSTGAKSSAKPTPSGPRKLEDIIAEQVETLKG
jgi:hypothetical protein